MITTNVDFIENQIVEKIPDFINDFGEAVWDTLPEECRDKEKHHIHGNVCEKIKMSENPEDYVTIPIENEECVDSGYIHVYGYCEDGE